MTIQSPSVNDGQQWLKKNYPNVQGTTLGTTKIDGVQASLIAQGSKYKDSLIKSTVLSRNRRGI